MKRFAERLAGLMLLALLIMPPQAWGALAVETASPTSDDAHEINNMTPGSSKTFLGNRLRGPLATGATTESVGATSAVDNVLAGETITTTDVNITTGSNWGSSTTLNDGQVNQVVTFTLTTDGGQDHKISPSTKTGFTDITLNDAGDSVTLKFVSSTIGWVIIGGEGYNIDSDFGVELITVGASSALDNVLAGESITAAMAHVTTGSAWGSSTTLNDGYINQELTFVLVTDGGLNHRISPSTKTGFTYIELDDANDSVSMKYIDDNYGWVVTGINGATVN